MGKPDIIVIGTSAGGVAALTSLLKALPQDLKASIFIVMHLSPYSKSHLPEILNQVSPFQAVHPKDGELIEPRKIYVASPDHHLLIDEGRVLVRQGPKENRFRPSVDALFRSAAYVYGSRVIGIVLTGMLDDGTSGLWTIKRLGGKTIIQDPEESPFPAMPASAMENVEIDYKLFIEDIAVCIYHLTQQKTIEANPVLALEEGKLLETEVLIAARGHAMELGIMHRGQLSPFTCPACSGVLISLTEGKMIRFRCHTGHAYSSSALLASVTESVEEMLIKVVRGIEETIMLLEQLGFQYKQMDQHDTAAEYYKNIRIQKDRASALREYVVSQEVLSKEKL